MKSSLCMLALIALFLGSQPLVAQTPIGDESLANARAEYAPGAYSTSCGKESSCIISWISYLEGHAEEEPIRLLARRMSPLGELSEEKEIRSLREIFVAYSVALPEGFALLWDEILPGRRSPVFQEFSHDLTAQTGVVETSLNTPVDQAVLAVGVTPNGYVFLNSGNDLPQDDSNCSGCKLGLFLRFVDFQGNLQREVQVNEDPSGYESFFAGGKLAVDAAGNLAIVFTRRSQDFVDGDDVFLRRFSPTGTALGPEIRVNSFRPGMQAHPQVAAAPDGRLLVVWESEEQDGDREGIYGRFFSSDGLFAGAEVRINSVTRSAQRWPTVVADPSGNFLVAWQSFNPDLDATGAPFLWDIKARLLREDGSIVASEIFLNEERLNEQTVPDVAIAPNGTFLAIWSSFGQAAPDSRDLYARRFSASPGEEPCAVAGGKLFCDTGRTGGFAELQLSFGGRPGEVTLLGDWDGEGREDVCAWFQGRFRCDLDHEGAPAEAKVDFGLASDIPLMGDVDGDGRAEACVRRKRRLLCDTGHDGGRPETSVVLGRGTEVPLLGDVDGDRRDDLCLFSSGQWECLTRAGARLSAAFGNPGDSAVLGDLDRDGRADLCVLREGRRLLCDTARNGGAAEAELLLEIPAGARPLFGNLDGL